jgi:hypothetical protein
LCPMVQQFNGSTVQRFNNSTVQRFNGSARRFAFHRIVWLTVKWNCVALSTVRARQWAMNPSCGSANRWTYCDIGMNFSYLSTQNRLACGWYASAHCFPFWHVWRSSPSTYCHNQSILMTSLRRTGHRKNTSTHIEA